MDGVKWERESKPGPLHYHIFEIANEAIPKAASFKSLILGFLALDWSEKCLFQFQKFLTMLPRRFRLNIIK